MKDLVAPFPRKPKVGLVGFFGWGNYGDELFLEHWHRHLDPYFDVEPVHDLLKVPYFSRDPESVARDYEAFVIGGGDLVIPNKVSELYWNKAWLQKKVYIAGVGVPTWIKHEKRPVMEHMREFFQHPNVHYISARDSESAAWIEEKLKPAVPVRVHPDLIFGMPLPPPREYDEPRTLGVSVRQRRVTAEDDYSELTALVEEARSRGFAIKAMVLGNGRTGVADEKAAERLPFRPFEIVRSESMEELTAALGGLTVLASMKFHGSLVASMYGVPSIVLSPTTKSKNLYRMLDREDLLSRLDDPKMPAKLDVAERRIDRGVVEGLVDDALDGMHSLVRTMRLEIDPRSLLPRSAAQARAVWKEFGLDAVRVPSRSALEKVGRRVTSRLGSVAERGRSGAAGVRDSARAALQWTRRR